MANVAQTYDIAPQPAAARGVLQLVLRNALPFVVVGAIWEAVAHLGLFPAQFFPTLEAIGATFVRLTASGVLPHHALDTVLRLLAGFALAAAFGVAVGVLMGRFAPPRIICCRSSPSARRSPASPMRRCFCCGSGPATCRRCSWSRSCRRFRSSTIR